MFAYALLVSRKMEKLETVLGSEEARGGGDLLSRYLWAILLRI